MTQETAPPPSTSPSEPVEEEKPVPKVYHMPFYYRPGTKEWYISQIENQKGRNNLEKTANWLLTKTSDNKPDDSELSAMRDVLLGLTRMWLVFTLSTH
jgi:hypothetical protein